MKLISHFDAFLKVKGRVDEYNGRLQLRLDKVRFAPDAEVGDFSRFFPVSQRPATGQAAPALGVRHGAAILLIAAGLQQVGSVPGHGPDVRGARGGEV